MLYSGKYVVTVSLVLLLVGSFIGYFSASQLTSYVSVNTGLSEQERQAAYESGYNIGLIDGAGSGFNIRDPSYKEALAFIDSDRTNLNKYNTISYNCFHFCRDFLDNAFASGFKAGFVYVEFPEGAHGMVCFDTVDKGLVYVEPQSDDIISLRVGYEYDFIEEPNEVTGFTVIW